jgi:hypothetical protein
VAGHLYRNEIAILQPKLPQLSERDYLDPPKLVRLELARLNPAPDRFTSDPKECPGFAVGDESVSLDLPLVGGAPIYDHDSRASILQPLCM